MGLQLVPSPARLDVLGDEGTAAVPQQSVLQRLGQQHVMVEQLAGEDLLDVLRPIPDMLVCFPQCNHDWYSVHA